MKFLSLSDGNGRVRFLFGPIPPKTYDSDIILMKKEFLDSNAKGAKVCADCHFNKANQYTEQVKWICPYSENEKEVEDLDEWNTSPALTIGRKTYNKQVRRIRNKVELPFAKLKNLFTSLRTPFKEGDYQLGCLVNTAVGIYNLQHH